MNKKTSYIVKIAMLSAIAFLLMYFEFPLPFVPPWLKFDISDLPAVLGAFALGPVGGVIIQLIKSVLFFLLRNSGTGGIGELANFLMGAALVLPAGMIYTYKVKFFFRKASGEPGLGELKNFTPEAVYILGKAVLHRTKTRKVAAVSLLVGALVAAVAAGVLNYWVLIPAYSKFMPIEAIISMCRAITPAADSVEMYVFIFAIPFTFAKMLITSLIVFLTYKRLSPMLHK